MPEIKYRNNQSHKKMIAEYFSRNAHYWDEIYKMPLEEAERLCRYSVALRKDAVLELLDRYSGKRPLRVLDAGCGAGAIMDEMLRRGYSVLGIDISEQMVRKAFSLLRKQGTAKAHCLQADIEEMPFKEQTFDVVLCIGVLPWLQNDHNSIREMSRVIRKGGIAMIIVPNLLRLSNVLDPCYLFYRGARYFWARARKYRHRTNEGTHETEKKVDFRRYLYGQLDGDIKTSRFRKIATRGVGFGPLTFLGRELRAPALSKMTGEMLERLSHQKLFSWLKIFAGQWVICIKKI